MSASNLYIYVMSGTGNSYRAATWLAEQAEQAQGQARLIAIGQGPVRETIPDDPSTLVALFMPTHGFTLPWHMLKFLFKLPRVRNAQALTVATRGGLKIGPVCTPGISGTATLIAALVLAVKGYSVRGAMSFDMPSNWMSLHWGLHPRNTEAIIARAERRARGRFDRILAGGQHWWTLNNLYEFLWGVALIPFSIGYLLFGRLFLAKLFFASNRCDRCGVCAAVCPVGAIDLKRAGDGRPYWKHFCESCMRCMAFCPNQAIEAGQNWAVLLGWLISIPFVAWGLARLGSWLPLGSFARSSWVVETLQLLYIYPAVFLSYFVFRQLLRIRLFNQLVT